MWRDSMVHFYLRIITFIVGVWIGVLLAVKYKNYVNVNIKKPDNKITSRYNIWFEKQYLKRKHVSWDTLRYVNHSYTTESKYLYKNIKVLCIILVRKSKNVSAINNTWGKGCTGIKFIEIFAKNEAPIKRTKKNSSWVLLCTALKNIKDDFDWIVIANDNTFVILENLRYYVANLNPLDTYYLGHAVIFWNTVYNSGEASYVLSKGSLRAFKNKVQRTECSTNTYWNREDFYLGKYLASLNITAKDTRDLYGFTTFHPYNWYHVFYPGENYYKTSVFPVKCCSKKSIAFQAIEGDKMYTYYYLLYSLQIFLDGKIGNQPLVDTIPDEQVWKQFLKERNMPIENISSLQYYKLWEDLIDDPTSFAHNMKKEVYFNYD